MPTALASNEEIRNTIRNRPMGDGAWREEIPAWQQEIVRTSDWHLMEHWTEDVGSQFGDYADGQASVSLYGHGADRIQIHTYPQWTEDYGEGLVHVCQQREGWTVSIDHYGNDVGTDTADLTYVQGETFFDTLAACQVEADRWGTEDDSWWMRGSTLSALMNPGR
jgi:hypothetical protein